MKNAAILAVGVSLIVFSFAAAMNMRADLQWAHFSKASGASALSAFPLIQLQPRTSAGAPTNSKGSGLPLVVVLAVVAGGVIAVYGGIASFFTLHKIKRKEYAAAMSFDQEVFTGPDFAHFNHRGRVVGPTGATK